MHFRLPPTAACVFPLRGPAGCWFAPRLLPAGLLRSAPARASRRLARPGGPPRAQPRTPPPSPPPWSAAGSTTRAPAGPCVGSSPHASARRGRGSSGPRGVRSGSIRQWEARAPALRPSRWHLGDCAQLRRRQALLACQRAAHELLAVQPRNLLGPEAVHVQARQLLFVSLTWASGSACRRSLAPDCQSLSEPEWQAADAAHAGLGRGNHRRSAQVTQSLAPA
eukprot:2954427-Rhodomonas_salina.2